MESRNKVNLRIGMLAMLQLGAHLPYNDSAPPQRAYYSQQSRHRNNYTQKKTAHQKRIEARRRRQNSR